MMQRFYAEWEGGQYVIYDRRRSAAVAAVIEVEILDTVLKALNENVRA